MDLIIISCLFWLALVACGCGLRAYIIGANYLVSAASIGEQTLKLKAEARIERDKWKFANMLSDATNNPN